MTAQKINDAMAILLQYGLSIRNENGNYVVFNDSGIFLITTKFEELIRFAYYIKKEMEQSE